MEKGKLALLRSEIKAQMNEIEAIYAKIEERRSRKDKAHLESLAYQLHNLYCAFEDLFKHNRGHPAGLDFSGVLSTFG